MKNVHETAATDQTAQQLRELVDYGPVRVVTREPGYTSEKGFRPLPVDPDQRRIFRLGNEVLTISDVDGSVNVNVATPDGSRELPLDQIERVGVDHPLGHDMPLHGRQQMSLVIMPWKDHENVPRWAPRAYERWDGSHLHEVLETSIDPDQPQVGVVRAYDISTPWDRKTSLETAKNANRPYSLYYISVLGAVGTEHGLTVITSGMGYIDKDRMANVLSPSDDYRLPKRAFDMLDIAKPTDDAVYQRHLGRIAELATEHGEAEPLRQMQVDEAFLYMSHD